MSFQHDTQHQPNDLEFSTQLNGKTTIERWFHALAPDRAHSPSRRTEVPWTAKRCKRLLRPLAAKLQIYKTALENLVHAQQGLSMTDTDGPAETADLDGTSSWLPPRKRLRRTYAARRSDPHTRPSGSLTARAHSIAWNAVQAAFLPVHDALRVYLPHQSFSPRTERRVPSLMLMCLRRLPALFERTERESERKAMYEDDPLDEMYDFLEERFGSKNGWKGFAYLLAARVTTLVVHAFLDEDGNMYRVEDYLYSLTLSKAGFNDPLPWIERFTLLPNDGEGLDEGVLENEGYFSGVHSLEYETSTRRQPDIAHMARLRHLQGRSNQGEPLLSPSYDELIRECRRFMAERSPPTRAPDISLHSRNVLWLKQCSAVSRDVLLSANIHPDAILPSLWTLILGQEISAHLVPNRRAQCGLDESDLLFLRSYDIPNELVLAIQEAFVQLWRGNMRYMNMLFGRATSFTVDLRNTLITLLRDGTPNIKHMLFSIVDDYANTFPSKESMVLALKLEEEWQESLEDEELEKLQVYPKAKIEDSATKRVYRFEESLGVWVTKTPYDYEARKRAMLSRVREARKQGRKVADVEVDVNVENEKEEEEELELSTVQAIRTKDDGTGGVPDMTPCPPRSIMLRLPPSPPSERNEADLDGHAADTLPLPRLPIIRRANPMAMASLVLSSDELGG